jgi:hypothetical protein
MESTSFLATHIHRIARRRLTGSAIWFGAMLILACASCALGLVSANSDSDIIMLFLCTTILGVGVGGWSLWNVIRYTRAVRNPAQSLSVIGFKSSEGLDKVVAQIDQEAAPYMGKLGAFVTEHWVISVRSNALEFMSLDEIVWIYKRSLGSVLGLLFGWHCAVVAWSRYGSSQSGRSMIMRGSEEQVERLLREIVQAIPWVEQEHSRSILEVWTNQRPVFVAAVDRRREAQTAFKVSSPVSTPPPAPLNLNDPANQKVIDAHRAVRDRQLRIGGMVFVIFGFLRSLLSILTLSNGVSEELEQSYRVFMFLWIGVWGLIAGISVVAFGIKAEDYLNTHIFKNGCRTALLVILFTTASFAFLFSAPALLRLLGYKFVSP